MLHLSYNCGSTTFDVSYFPFDFLKPKLSSLSNSCDTKISKNKVILRLLLFTVFEALSQCGTNPINCSKFVIQFCNSRLVCLKHKQIWFSVIQSKWWSFVHILENGSWSLAVCEWCYKKLVAAAADIFHRDLQTIQENLQLYLRDVHLKNFVVH